MKTDIKIYLSFKESEEIIKQFDDLRCKAYPNYKDMSKDEVKELEKKYSKLVEFLNYFLERTEDDIP